MKNTELKTERSWIEINVQNLKHNIETLKKAMPPECKLMAVVKTDAYGHGACEISANLNKMGVKAFAVATIDEGIKLRQAGIHGDILILGYTDVGRAFELKKFDLIQTLIDFKYAESLNSQNVAIKVHIKIDTGMHRLGIPSGELSLIKEVFFMKNLSVHGMFTHLCCADSRLPEDVAFTREQIARFYGVADAVKDSGIKIPRLHIQSSYGLLNYPDLACDYIRAGIALYGVLSSPNDDTVLKLDLRPVLSLNSRVVLIRPVKKGDSIGYGRSYTTGRDSRIAVIPIGYGDGFPRNLSDGNCSVLIKGHIAPVVGRICMDQITVDITDAADVMAGDIVTLIGAGGYGELSAPVVADHAGSISNELLCRMGARLPIIPAVP